MDIDSWEMVEASKVFQRTSQVVSETHREELIKESNVSREVFEELCKHHKRDPVNPIGSCFDSSAHQIVFGGDDGADLRLVHAIGITSIPSQAGQMFCHAWVEFFDPQTNQKIAIDTTWGIPQLAENYRNSLQISYSIEYTRQEAFDLWKTHNYPGPWDERLMALQKKKGL